MRKVTETIVHAFMDRETKCIANSSTDGESLFLHGNKIAWHGVSGIFMTLAGWNTPTTRERLNGILRVMGHNYRDGECGALNFYQRKHEPFIGENTSHKTAIELSGSDVIFVVHPCSAKGMAAVHKSAHDCDRHTKAVGETA